MRRRRVLVVTPYPLLPADSGGRLHALACSRFVPDDVEMHLLALVDAAERRELAAGGDALRARYGAVFRSVHFTPRPPVARELGSTARVLAHFLAHAALGLPLMDVSYYSREAVRLAQRIARDQRIDLLEVHHLQCAFYRRALRQVPAILINHNLEHELFPFWGAPEVSAVEKRIWDFFAHVSRRNARAIEVDNALGFAAKLFISPRDLASVGDGCPKILLPFGVELDTRPKTFHRDRFVALWIGGFDWPPNLYAALWLANEIWPLVQAGARGPVELHFAGAHPPPELRERHDGRALFVHGHVPDADAMRSTADVLVAPLRTGGGVRIKIVEALNAGLPVVSTAKGTEGLGLTDGVEVRLANQTEEFVRALLDLEGSVDLRERLSVAGRAAVARGHSPEVVVAAKRRAYDLAR